MPANIVASRTEIYTDEATQAVKKSSASTVWRASTVLLGQMIGVFVLLQPILGYSVWREWEVVQSRQIEDVIHRANALAASQMILAASTRSLLISMALAAAIQSGHSDSIARYFEKLEKLQQNYSGFAFFTQQGDTVAAVYKGNPRFIAPETVRERGYFKEAIQHNRFNISLPFSVDGALLLPMTMPVTDVRGVPQGTLMAAVSLPRQQERMQGTVNDGTSRVAVFDGAHRMLFACNQNFTQDTFGAMLGEQSIELFLRTNAYSYADNEIMPRQTFLLQEGDKRFIGAVASLQVDEQPPYMYILVMLPYMPLTEFLFKRYLPQAVASAILVVLALWAAASLGRRYFTTGLERLAEVAAHNQTGPLTMRCGTIPGCSEIQILSTAFDTMLDEIERKTKELLLLSHTDPLTELWNRRYFEKISEHYFNLACRYKRPLTIIMIDIDHFKKINDTYGHTSGDTVLYAFAQILKNNIRSVDLLARYGGEEFILLLPDTDVSGAAILLEKLRALVESTICLTVAEQPVYITASFGAAGYAGTDAERPDLLRLQEQADAALYTSKQQGRNRVTIA